MDRLLNALAAYLLTTLPSDHVVRRIEIAKAAWEERQLIDREDWKSGPKFVPPAKEARKELQKASKRFKRRKRFGSL